MESLSQTEIKEYSEAFSMYDDEGDGVIGLDKMGPILKSLGLEPFPTWLETLQQQRRDEGEDTVTYVEFLSLMADNKTTAQKAAQNENKRVTAIVEAFASFDTNDTGLVKNDDVRSALLTLGMTDGEITKMITHMDPDGTGQIKYMEYAEHIIL
jgi:calmodulin|eukprot:CAMPEP_0174286560 /NCGR_PEP_ID=MMETSP0809-20121228/12473_1 /TAXON_ID=73025 ORGANISM="Eutreptiella gymnastica-like, Strain CCMP1594" /NCGR_SAMPLE_ID=MMETSP0809 /ASSEMBLY_ACC=CAM_ASM_000658 /LENGTH=153 /DNA_ID=CAMNT_0015382691 /DNA_START=66 /DNA_END=527 /DNA_ORIENTATION=+